MVKNPFGRIPVNVFQLGFVYMSYRQVLTPIHNSQLLLKLPILDKFRLAIFHKSATQRNYSIKTGINQFRGETRVLMTLNQATLSEDEHHLSVHCFYNDAKLQCFSASQVKQRHYHTKSIFLCKMEV